MKQTPEKYFGKSKVSHSLPYLLSLQQESWKSFWKNDLRELFSEVSPIRDHTGEEMELWLVDYKLGKSKYKNEFEAKENNDSYEAPLRVKVRLVNVRTKEVKEQEVFFADFPLMTERGTFVMNGVERVIVSQLIRSPGLFFTAEYHNGKQAFGAKIVPNRGAWLEFITEPSGVISVKVDRRKKIPVSVLLKAFGVESNEKLSELFSKEDEGEVRYLEETLKKDTTNTHTEALVELYERLKPGEPATPEGAQELLENMFSNFSRYDLSKVGRWRFWKRFPEMKKKLEESEKNGIKPKDRVLGKDDIVAIVREIIRLNNTPEAKPDQIDHLGNRRVRTISELLQNRLRVGLMRMERIAKDRMATLDASTLTPLQLVNPKPVMAVTREFFSSSQLSQFMDNENPLSELEHKRRLAATGPGGLTRERAGFEVRDVQPSHYGRICPIETPEGPNIGLVTHMALHAKVNDYGFIETPYYRVKEGKVTSELVYLTAHEEEQYNIAHTGVPIDEKKRIVPDKVGARVQGEPGLCPREKIDFIDVSSEQGIAVATSLVPFLQNDDANRAQMGANMQRQAVPLLKPEPPLVGTGVEDSVARDSGQIVLASEDGTIASVDASHITLKGKSGKTHRYDLRTFTRTNQYTCFHQKPTVKRGQKVKKGDVLSDGGAIAQGKLSLGQNVRVAFVPWRGGNFEDAILVSERLVQQDAFTSIHIESFTYDVRETKLRPEITTADIPNVSEEKLKDLDKDGIVRVGAEVGPGDILVGKIAPKGETELTAEERLLRAIFGEKARDVKDASLLMEHGKRGKVVGVKVFSRDAGHKLEPGVIKRIEVEVAQTRKIKAGDKLAGRHGNKGVISRVLPVEDMPFLEDGTPVDIVLNPLGVASRMNLGQILETHLSWAAKELGYLAVTPGLSGATEEDIKRELKKAGFPEDGKAVLYDGKTGTPFQDKVTVGNIYMMKLVHMVEDKIHMRSIGPYSLITQQPLGGKSQFGGQRFGEMEVWALEGYGAAYSLQEMLTIKSDDVPGRAATYEAILKGEEIRPPNVPASFNLLTAELKALGLDIRVEEDSSLEEEDSE